jgi:hypothetical protein
MNPQTLHALARAILPVWIALYVIPFLWVVAANIGPFVFSGFELSNPHGLEILYGLYKGALWLIPTSFLLILYYCTDPRKVRLQQG